ncbi:MAG: hypothetical protein H0Z34_14875 [Brevibacillus sp.]|nr:hypothetical protein [Brevibacillus sp.]
MGDKGILLGKRQFLFGRAQTITLKGWRFHVATGFTVIAGGTEQSAKNLISIYRDMEKMAQLKLVDRGADTTLTVEAIASEITLEVDTCTRFVSVIEKADR